jgi:hypothetical protein
VVCGVAGKPCCGGRDCTDTRTYCSIQATYTICVVKYANGQGCGSTNMDVDEHCASGFCENNVCCNMRCAASCTGGTCLSGLH